MSQDENKIILEIWDKKFVNSLFEILLQIHLDNFKLKFNKVSTVNNILKNIKQKYNIDNFINNLDNINLNLEIFLKNKFDNKKWPIVLLNINYKSIIQDEFQMIEMWYLKYDNKFEYFLFNLLITIINYFLTLPFIGFNYIKNIKSNYLSKLHKYFLLDYIIYSDNFENSSAKFNKDSDYFSKEKFNYEYIIENKEVSIKILNIDPYKNDILSFLNTIKIQNNLTKGRNRILSGENYKIYKDVKEKRNRKSNDDYELKENFKSNIKNIPLFSIKPPFEFQSDEILKKYKKNSTADYNSDSEEKDEEYTLVSYRNADELEISYSQKINENQSKKEMEKILKDNSKNFLLGNDLDSFFSYTKYSKFKLNDLYKNYIAKEDEEESNIINKNDDEIIFNFDNLYKFENFGNFMENFKI